MSFVVFLGLPGLNHDIPFSMQRGQGSIRGVLLCWPSPHKTCFAIVSEKHINTFQIHFFPSASRGECVFLFVFGAFSFWDRMTINHYFLSACMEGRDQSGESCSGHPFTKLVSQSSLRRFLYDSMQFFPALRVGNELVFPQRSSPPQKGNVCPQKKVICVSPRMVICVAPSMSSLASREKGHWCPQKRSSGSLKKVTGAPR